MYGVVIIDDEPIIVEGLSKSIPWGNWGCQVVGTAADGDEGLQVIREKKPDILISDICMPTMSGLAMIAALKSEYPEMEITILSGYREFEYAREAIRLGVTRFLMKPSKMEELREAMDVMVAHLQQKEASHELAFTEHADTGELVEEEALEVSTAGSFIIKNAIKYMEEHYMEKLKLSDVADHVYVSQWHLSKLLNGYAGQSFSDMLNTIRIDHAKELLEDPSLRISDITDMVGFLDIAHFSRVFKKLTGVSAGEYRNRKIS
ncbi:MAG: response regulator [Lachnospiraceae bacterium]